MTQPDQTAPLWCPSPERVRDTAMDQFRCEMGRRYGEFGSSIDLHAWSVAEPDAFWDEVFSRAVVTGDRGAGPAVVREEFRDPRDESFFPSASVNYAENLLVGGTRPGAGPLALIYRNEGGGRRELTWTELADQVALVAAGFADAGVGPGSRIAAWLPNCPEAVVTMLAANALGAVYSSTSPDFGVAGVSDRFAQIDPVVLVVADGYRYGGKSHRRLGLLPELLERLPTVRLVLVVGELGEAPDLPTVPGVAVVAWPTVAPDEDIPPLEFHRMGMRDPGFILFSSGTTGMPKCIVHSALGLLLKHWTEHALHSDIRPGDRVFYFTTCGWMMWNWLVGTLALGATVVLFDGSPFSPDPAALWDLAAEEGVSFFGVGAKYVDSCRKSGLSPAKSHELGALRTIASTGSPLSIDCFDYIYRDVKADVHLASISGGTDLCGCFVLGDPTRPVFAGQIQGPALGLDVDVFDESGRSLADEPGVQGDLVCRNGFPTVPLGFLGDDGGARFEAAYFATFPGVWTHGDFASWTENHGIVISGRSDATLNSGGVRIGTAEIYRVVEAMPDVLESLAIGQQEGEDTRIVLFVRLAPGTELDEDLVRAIKTRLRTEASPRHVPAVVLAVADLPRTRSGKLAELAVADVVHGREVRNVGALANPEVLGAFRGIVEISE